jgi:hypothetical protein
MQEQRPLAYGDQPFGAAGKAEISGDEWKDRKGAKCEHHEDERAQCVALRTAPCWNSRTPATF